LFSFLHYFVTPGLHPSTVFCLYFFSFTFFVLFLSCNTAHFFPWISVLCRCIPLFLFHSLPLLIHFLCIHSNFSCLHFVHLGCPSNCAPKGAGAAGLQPSLKPPRPKFKKWFCKYYDTKCCTLFTIQLKSTIEISWWLVHIE
jgi:hypothetical protein